MSTKMMKMTIEEAKEELVANERMQEAIAEKFDWPELTDKEYIAAELRLSECQAEEEVLRSTIDFWEQFQKGLDKKVEKSLLIILSLSIFLSPTFRSLAIWPSSRIVGLLFFVLSIYEFLKFQKTSLNIHLIKNILFLIISSYISPNFSLFIIFFFYYYLKKINIKTITLILLFCIYFPSNFSSSKVCLKRFLS